MKKKSRRWRLIADVRLQGVMILRLAIYWMICQISMVGTLLGFSFLGQGGSDGDGGVGFIFQALVVSTLIFPVVALELLAFSNRFAGPLVNFRRRLAKLVESGTAEKITFRDGDFFEDLSDNFNLLREQLQATESESKPVENIGKPFPSVEISSPTGSESNV